MAKATDNKKTKPSFSQRVGNFFKGIGRSFKNMFHEMKKVTWPTKKEMLNYSVVVFIFMIIMGVIIGVIDLGAGQLIKLIVKS